jgi:cation/acetate symporter
MTDVILADPPPPVDNTWAAPAIGVPLALAIGLVVFFLVRSARGSVRDADDFLVAGRRIDVRQNTLAFATAPIMYSTMVIITGHIALNGFDAVLLMTAFTVSMLVALLIYASPLRNVGGHTLGDLFAVRADERTARTASATLILLTYVMFLIVTMAALAFIIYRLFNVEALWLVGGLTAVVGLIVVAYVFMGGMLGVTKMLMVKAVLVIAFIALLTVLALAKFNLNVFSLLQDAEANAVPDKRGYDLLGPGRLFGEGSTRSAPPEADPWVHLSKVFSIVVGTAGIPFLFMRNYAVTNGRDARRSVGWASMIVVGFYACMCLLGLGAIAILGKDGIGIIAPHRDITLPKLVDELGGPVLSGALAAISLLVVAGVLAALLINVVTSVTKDINVVRGRKPAPGAELKDIRRNVVIVGVVSVLLGVAMLPALTHIFIPTSIDLGGAAVLPAVVYSLYWRRFNTAGLKWTVYGGIAVTMFMVVFSNGVSGDEAALFPDADFKFVDIEPGLISVPVAFLLGWIGTLTSRERNDAAFAEMQVRALTGAVVPARGQALADGADAARPGREAPAPSEAH